MPLWSCKGSEQREERAIHEQQWEVFGLSFHFIWDPAKECKTVFFFNADIDQCLSFQKKTKNEIKQATTSNG